MAPDEPTVVGVTEQDRKVVHLFGGKGVSLPNTGAGSPETAGPEIDADAIKYIEELLVRFKAGELRGACFAVGKDMKNGMVTDIETWITNAAFDQYMTFLGGTAMLHDHMMSASIPMPLEDGE